MILCQDAYGPGTKIELGLKAGAIAGAVLSPRWRRESSLPQAVDELSAHQPDAEIIFDPSLYLAELRQGLFKKAESYEYFEPGLKRARLRRLGAEGVARAVLAAQMPSRLTALVSPGIRVESPEDWRSEFNLGLYESFLEMTAEDPRGRGTLLSLVLDEGALSNKDRLGELLDELTMYEARGFYLVILRETDKDPMWGDPTRLTRLVNLLYLVRVLALNGFEVHVGYCDLNGFLLRAAGATSVATSWFKSSRQACLAGIGDSKGGQQPRALYASAPLLSWVLLSPDLATIDSLGRIDDVLTPEHAHEEPNPLVGAWARGREVVEYWQTMSYLERQLPTENARARVEAAMAATLRAIALRDSLASSGMPWERPPRHLDSWLTALRSLDSTLGLELDQ